MIRRGFTVVELIITITIMGILLLLTVVGLNTTQVNARDDERTADIAVIAQNLENFYTTGGEGSTSIGRYPSLPVGSYTEGILQSTFRDMDLKTFTAPGATSVTTSFIPATNATQTTAGVAPQPTISQYVYQALQPDGSLCTNGVIDCRKFNLYYRLEATNEVQMVTSKNQ